MTFKSLSSCVGLVDACLCGQRFVCTACFAFQAPQEACLQERSASRSVKVVDVSRVLCEE